MAFADDIGLRRGPANRARPMRRWDRATSTITPPCSLDSRATNAPVQFRERHGFQFQFLPPTPALKKESNSWTSSDIWRSSSRTSFTYSRLAAGRPVFAENAQGHFHCARGGPQSSWAMSPTGYAFARWKIRATGPTCDVSALPSPAQLVGAGNRNLRFKAPLGNRLRGCRSSAAACPSCREPAAAKEHGNEEHRADAHEQRTIVEKASRRPAANPVARMSVGG